MSGGFNLSIGKCLIFIFLCPVPGVWGSVVVTWRMGVVVWGALSRAPHYCQLKTHLVTHHGTNLSHCLDGYLGSTYSGRYGRFVRERAQGSTLGWFISTGNTGIVGGDGWSVRIHCLSVKAVTPPNHEVYTFKGMGDPWGHNRERAMWCSHGFVNFSLSLGGCNTQR